MPFRRILFDNNGQAGTAIASIQRVYVLNDSGHPVTVVDGTDNFTLQPSTYVRWTPASTSLSFIGTAATSFLFAWGDFKIDPMPGTGGFQNVEVYDSSGNAIASATSLPAVGARGLVVRLPNQQVIGITGTVSISAANNLPVAPRGTYSGGPIYGQQTLAVTATSIYAIGAGSSGITVRALAVNAGDVFLGDASVSTANGCPLSPGQGIAIPAPSVGGTTVYGVSSNGTDTVGYIAY
jgi:hypothetical protein